MHTKESLMNDLKNMGLTGEEAIMVHSSMKSIGEVEGAQILWWMRLWSFLRKVFEVCAKFFAIEETCIIERDEIPETWWKE